MKLDQSSGAPAAGHDAVPLFHAAWLFALGIAIAHWVWLRPSLVLAAVVAIAVLCIVEALRIQRIMTARGRSLVPSWRLVRSHGASSGTRACPWLLSLMGCCAVWKVLVVDTAPVRSEIEQNLNDD
jgi:hypothetical protein